MRAAGASLAVLRAAENLAGHRGRGRLGGGRGAGGDERLNVCSEPAGEKDGLRGQPRTSPCGDPPPSVCGAQSIRCLPEPASVCAGIRDRIYEGAPPSASLSQLWSAGPRPYLAYYPSPSSWWEAVSMRSGPRQVNPRVDLRGALLPHCPPPSLRAGAGAGG